MILDQKYSLDSPKEIHPYLFCFCKQLWRSGGWERRVITEGFLSKTAGDNVLVQDVSQEKTLTF